MGRTTLGRTQRETLLDTWRGHCAQLTVQQLGSPDVLTKHLATFHANVVGRGLAETALDGHTDVHNVIASWISDEPTLPTAKALHELTVRSRSMIASQLASEASKLASQMSLEGRSGLDVPMRTLPSAVKTLHSLRSKAEQDIEEQLQRYLRSAGFDVNVYSALCYRHTPGHKGSLLDYNLCMSWDKAG